MIITILVIIIFILITKVIYDFQSHRNEMRCLVNINDNYLQEIIAHKKTIDDLKKTQRPNVSNAARSRCACGQTKKKKHKLCSLCNSELPWNPNHLRRGDKVEVNTTHGVVVRSIIGLNRSVGNFYIDLNSIKYPFEAKEIISFKRKRG